MYVVQTSTKRNDDTEPVSSVAFGLRTPFVLRITSFIYTEQLAGIT